LSSFRRFLFGRDPRRTAVRVLVLAGISFVTFKWMLIPIRTQGVSMLPTYSSGTFNLVNRLSYVGRNAAPKRGDIVAIRLAGPNVVYVKRIVGMPGERVSIVEGWVHINGQSLPEPYVRHRRAWDVPEVTLGPHEYFVVGDNRGMAAGDHDFGRVDDDRILGRVLF
jgi:signal peptidase I